MASGHSTVAFVRVGRSLACSLGCRICFSSDAASEFINSVKSPELPSQFQYLLDVGNRLHWTRVALDQNVAERLSCDRSKVSSGNADIAQRSRQAKLGHQVGHGGGRGAGLMAEGSGDHRLTIRI